ncbi:MAG: hypothetical protein J5I93_29160 [Pirellulaceae bacterium]|nr:hypothetical protein [Pirellulaceae bacterium]
MIIGLMAVWTGLGTFAFGDSLGPNGGHLVDIRNMATAATSHHAEWSADEQTGSVSVHLLDLARQPVEAEGADLAIEVLWQGETTRYPLAADAGHLTASDADLAAALLPLSEWTRPRLVGKLRGEDVSASLSRQDGIFSRLRPASHDYQIQLPVSMAAAAAPLAVATDGQSLAEIARQWRAATTEVPAESPSLAGNGWRWAWDWLRYGAIQTVNILPTVQIEAKRPETLGSRLGPFHAGYWLLIVAGVGIFCGCVGKSAQFPLHVWLPDAMEGPTPVSALVHSATMVAAGVYLVGRFFPTFTPEVLLVIATAGCITLFIAATIAITATDIKRVLAYSTISQLGYMMLALGLGGWLAGLMHLVTHAFFKSLLFLCSGSVIHAVHTNEMPKMGGLLRKMPITAITMLVGCLAIAGISVPFVVGFSGYYSKDAILEQAFAFMQQNPGSFFGPLLFVTAAGGAAMTAFYMFRLWFMTFVGKPRDHHRYDHAHESPKVMYVPLIILAVLATGVAWPGPTEAVYVAVAAGLLAAGLYGYGKLAGGEGDSQGHFRTVAYTLLGSAAGLLVLAGLWSVVGINLHDLLEQARPAGTTIDTRGVLSRLVWPDEHFAHQPPQFWTIVFPVTMLATATAVGGILLAAVIYAWGYLSPADIRRQFEPVYRLLWNKWWFDELYGWLFVRPVTWISQCAAGFDRKWIDGFIDSTAWGVAKFARIWERIADQNVVDGLVNGLADWTFRIGVSLRILQTGRLRQYVMFIVIAALAIFVLISVFWSPTLAQ